MENRIKEVRKKFGITATKLAEMVDISRPYMSQIENNTGGKRPSGDLLMRFAAALDVPVSKLFPSDQAIAVAGRIGAGAEVQLVDAYEKGDGLYQVACPDGLSSSGVVAVEVVGDSMAPIIQPGDVLFFSRHFFGIDENALGRVSICETEDGRALVKHITKGRDSGTFDLMSANNTTAAEYSVRLKWAAPMRRHVPKEEVEIL